MNARLAARLTGWKIDIKSDTEFATEEAEAAYAGDGEAGDTEFTGRCSAVLSTGKRCPNAALPGSRYCGVPAHQELALRPDETPDEEPIVGESEPGLEMRADLAPPEAESIGPHSVEPVGDDEELQSAGAADAVATHGPSAEAIAEAEGEVDLDVAHPEHAPPEERPGGIPVEPLDEVPAAEDIETPVDVSGGAGLEQTLEGHDTAVGEPPYAGPEEERGDAA
jgi:N utilization substance protein A